MIDIGKKLSGRYEIIGNIGSGGMANVFLARDLILDREVAVKVLRFDFQNDQTAIRRFQREALAATELVHPNIVSVYDVGEEDGTQYLVMEYVKGMDLKRYIQTSFPIPFKTVVDIMDQILSAVQLAHDHRIIHRDLKPQNILINEDGEIKITDFGIAIALSETSLTQTNSMLGSVHYLSPEQARGSMATRRSDIYALGIVLFEMLTGQVPFDGESAVTIALKHFQEPLPKIRVYNSNTPQSLENIVLHATAKDPADRYQSAEEMQEDLATVLDPARMNEPRWEPQAMEGATKVITPIPVPLDTHEETAHASETESKGEKKKPKKSRKKMAFIAIGVVLAVLIGAGLWALGSGAKEVTVPDVSDMTVEEAASTLEDAGLKVAKRTKEVADEEIEEGKVVKTSPEADDVVTEGREVTLYISSGGQTIELPDFTGQQYEDVVEDLLDLGFKTDQIKRNTVEVDDDDDAEEGEVVGQDPEAGEKVNPKEDTITLSVSKGPETAVLDNLSGMTQADAEAYLDDLGLNIKVGTGQEYHDTIASGNVIRTEPGSGSTIKKGATVKLIISSGPQTTNLDSSKIVGQSEDAATEYLNSLGLELKISTSEEFSDDVEEGDVISINPTSVKNGDEVTLVISKGQEEKNTTFDVTVSAKYDTNIGGSEQVISIWKKDANGTSGEIASLTVTPASGTQSTTISVTAKEGESATIYTQRGDSAAVDRKSVV